MKEETKGSFVLYLEHREFFEKLSSDKQRSKLIMGIFDYEETGQVPPFDDPVVDMAFVSIRQVLDRNDAKWLSTRAARSKAGKAGGISSGKIRSNKKEATEANASFASNEIASEANASFASNKIASEANASFASNKIASEAVNANVIEDANVNERIVSDSMSDISSISDKVLNHLNSLTGSTYKTDAQSIRLIDALLKAGFSPSDIIKVINIKVAEWLNIDVMRPNLRPSTLFKLDKFPEYLNGPVPSAIEKEKLESEKIASMEITLSTKKKHLESTKKALDNIDPRNNRKQYNDLKMKEAELEDAIHSIEKQLNR